MNRWKVIRYHPLVISTNCQLKYFPLSDVLVPPPMLSRPCRWSVRCRVEAHLLRIVVCVCVCQGASFNLSFTVCIAFILCFGEEKKS